MVVEEPGGCSVQILTERKAPDQDVLIRCSEWVAERPAAEIEVPAKLARGVGCVARRRPTHRSKWTLPLAGQGPAQFVGEVDIVVEVLVEDAQATTRGVVKRRRRGPVEDPAYIHPCCRGFVAGEEAVQRGAVEPGQRSRRGQRN